jgi:tRNA (cytosine38-C5)-methyltransferase
MPTKVLELFSGIGGMRCGLTEAIGAESDLQFTAVDLNELCNKVYEDSFGEKPEYRDITGLTVQWFEALHADVWTMSPPCQPYSRQGLMLGSQDNRAKPLHHLIKVLEKLENLPRLIVVENVKNFELSDSFSELKKVLEKRGFGLHAYLLNPLYMGFPNSRLRFFLIAVLGDVSSDPLTIMSNDPAHRDGNEFIDTESMFPRRRIGDFLCKNNHSESLNVKDSVLEKRASFSFDIVAPRSRQCLCFTRSYRKFINGTGSVLLQGQERKIVSWDEMDRPKFEIDSMKILSGKLRYFCPLEAARLNGFNVNDPEADWSLKFEQSCEGSIHYYRAVGNSLNPHVVSFLVKRHWNFTDS